MNALVAYFSYGGNTRMTGQKSGMKRDADFYEIAPKVPYTADDVNWQDDTSRNVKEYKDLSSRPEMDHQMPDLSRYDVIYPGFPIRWYGYAWRLERSEEKLSGIRYPGRRKS